MHVFDFWWICLSTSNESFNFLELKLSFKKKKTHHHRNRHRLFEAHTISARSYIDRFFVKQVFFNRELSIKQHMTNRYEELFFAKLFELYQTRDLSKSNADFAKKKRLWTHDARNFVNKITSTQTEISTNFRVNRMQLVYFEFIQVFNVNTNGFSIMRTIWNLIHYHRYSHVWDNSNDRFCDVKLNEFRSQNHNSNEKMNNNNYSWIWRNVNYFFFDIFIRRLIFQWKLKLISQLVHTIFYQSFVDVESNQHNESYFHLIKKCVDCNIDTQNQKWFF